MFTQKGQRESKEGKSVCCIEIGCFSGKHRFGRVLYDGWLFYKRFHLKVLNPKELYLHYTELHSVQRSVFVLFFMTKFVCAFKLL